MSAPRVAAAPDGRGGAPAGRASHSCRRLRREEQTLTVMVGMYCRDHHRGAGAPVDRRRPGAAAGDGVAPGVTSVLAVPLCSDCVDLLDYARSRLARCPYGARKPTCAKCTTHCYARDKREQVRAVMRHSGPRMVSRHPLLAAAHLIDGRRTPPGR